MILTRQQTNQRGCAFCDYYSKERKYLCKLNDCPFDELSDISFDELAEGYGDYREFMEDWKGHRRK